MDFRAPSFARPRNDGDPNGRPHQPLPRGLRALDARPGGLLGRGARRRSTGTSRRDKSSTRTPGSTAAGSPAPTATPATTRSTATWSAGAATQPAIIYNSPVTSTKRVITYAEMLAEVKAYARRDAARISASPRATASSSTCRWCRRRSSPCSPARASARSTAWCSAASRRRNSQPASTTAKPKLILSASCGIEVRASCRTSRCSMPRSILPSTRPTACLILQRPQAKAAMIAGPRPRLGGVAREGDAPRT